MLKLRKLAVRNFGPYRHEQEIVFPPQDGVTIVHGENQRGKTSLLNAIRYALFGTVLSRGERPLPFTQIENREEAQDGTHGFSVTLEFDYHSVPYKLTRTVAPLRAAVTPTSNADYKEECFLERAGHMLSQESVHDELTRIMPETVSRFFLFDGELLQQYEALLHFDDDIGVRIKESIERILGVPVLTNARAAAKEFVGRAQQQEGKAATKNQKTQEFGAQYTNLTAKREGHREELQRKLEEIEELKAQKKTSDSEVARYARVSALFQERERLRNALGTLEQREQDKKQRLKIYMADAWLGVLRCRVNDVYTRLEQTRDALQTREARRVAAEEALTALAGQQISTPCPTCSRDLSPTERDKLVAILRNRASEDSHGREELAKVVQQLGTLRSGATNFDAGHMQELLGDIDEIRQEHHGYTRRLGEIDEETADHSETSYRDSCRNRDLVERKLMAAEEGAAAERRALEEVDQNIEKIHRQLTRYGGDDLARHARRAEIAAKLYALLDAAVALYRERLRKRVEADASDLFLRLTSEPDYSGLRINENYGLQIMHRDGDIVSVRSAGAEHIVALSLIGALQKNAPLRGPIIMDSPFGRLDRVHTEKVVSAMPTMAPQVVLLIHGNELDKDMVRRKLGGNMRREYRIQRKTARHSVIEVCHD